jgi:hypothetical protein
VRLKKGEFAVVLLHYYEKYTLIFEGGFAFISKASKKDVGHFDQSVPQYLTMFPFQEPDGMA